MILRGLCSVYDTETGEVMLGGVPGLHPAMLLPIARAWRMFPGAMAWLLSVPCDGIQDGLDLLTCDSAADRARTVRPPPPSRDKFPAALELCARLDAGYDLACASGFAYDAARKRFGRAFPGDGTRPPLPVLRIPAKLTHNAERY
jgi:hypothetical protein